MPAEEKIDIELFKVVFTAMAQSNNLEIMTNHLSQLLVAALGMKGCSIFAINPETEELEVLASFGLSMDFVHKGPILKDKSIGAAVTGEPIIIRDINETDRLQYPDDAKKEGIGAVVSIPIKFYDKVIGDLRLYHHEFWNISEKDVDSLSVLARNIGLAMAYTHMLKAVKKIKYTVDDLDTLW
jgi:signal transduction protein with GAF and PtsI domain